MMVRILRGAIPVMAWLVTSLGLAGGPATRAADGQAAERAQLPGQGLAQHDFLYTGEWDTRKPEATLFLIKGGQVVWTYQIPRKDPNGNESEFSDAHLLSNGDVVYACKTGWPTATR